jgi:enoyl-[acyl-carrier-protein] reductase (NADH)
MSLKGKGLIVSVANDHNIAFVAPSPFIAAGAELEFALSQLK